MPTHLPKGILPALLTPFEENEEINWDVFDRMIEDQLAAGVDGLYVGGATSECFYLTLDERKQVAKRAVEVVAGAVPVMAHVACGSTRETLELARHAEASGAAAVSSMPPYFFKLPFRETLAFYQELAAAVDVPVVTYYIPILTGVEFSAEQFEDLLSTPNVRGIKFTSAALHQLPAIKEHKTKPIAYNGFDEICLAGLMMGADGAIGSYYNLVPELAVAMWKAFTARDFVKAQELQLRLTALVAATLPVGGGAAFKFLMRTRGLDCGNRRRPSQPLSDDVRRQLLAAFAEWKERGGVQGKAIASKPSRVGAAAAG